MNQAQRNSDAMIQDVTSGMNAMQVDGIQNPQTGSSTSGARSQQQQQQQQRRRLVTPSANQRRPMDDVVAAGPPALPIDFPKPRFERGCRNDVLCYNERTQAHDVAHNVLFRDYSREFGTDDGAALSRVQQAYWPLPYKAKINTIMGHVEICVVLERIRNKNKGGAGAGGRGGNHDDDDGSESSAWGSSDSSMGDEDEDIVFQVTQKYVAVKVNYADRMERLRGRHAEDPLKEIAAMQVIGQRHPNVLGCIEVLFDGRHLNVVLPYCGNGDLFELLQESQAPADPSQPPGVPEGQARYWFRQVMAGVQYLHSIGICHRDLSPENVMIDGNGCLIIDMGMCLRIPYTNPNPNGGSKGSASSRMHGASPSTSASPSSSSAAANSSSSSSSNPDTATNVTDARHGTHRRMILPQGACGKLPYMSPEIYRNRDAFDGNAIDVWTAGTILFCMVTGNRSYERPHSSDPQFYWMANGIERLIADWGVTITPECLHLLKNMLQIDPRLRFTTKEVLDHPWFQYPDEIPPRFGSLRYNK